MTTGQPDPIDAWRELSARAARSTGVRRPLPVAGRRPATTAAGLGAVTVGIVVVLAALVLRPPTGPAQTGLVTAIAEDGTFRLTLSTPRERYGPSDAIEPIATVTYLGPDPTTTIYHATNVAQFRIEEVGGERAIGGGTRQPCRPTNLAKDEPITEPFRKGGSPDATFDEAWYEDPVLRLPAGTWRIVAMLDVKVGGCGGETHALEVANVIQIAHGVAVGTPFPTGSADPTLTAPSEPATSPTATSSPTAPGPPQVTPSASPVSGIVDDGVFRLDLTTSRATYGPNEAIDSSASVTYLGPDANETMYHGSSPVGFVIEEVDGPRRMGGGMDLPCLNTAVEKDAPLRYPFAKAGTTDDGFDMAWYRDPVLRLPVGTWRIRAYLEIYVTDGTATCGGIHHRLDVQNVITVR